MKKFIFLILVSITAFLYAQNNRRCITDGERTIHYYSIADAEKKIIEYIDQADSHYGFPSELFSELVMNDNRCFTYDFKRLIESSHRTTVRPLRVKTSDDGNLRLYTWDTDGGTMSCYSGIISYRNSTGITSHTSVTEDSWDYESADESLKPAYIACGAYDIKTIRLSDGKCVYAIYTHSSGSSIMQMTTVEAYVITANGIEPYNLFKHNGEEGNSVSFYRNPSGSFPADIIQTDKEFLIPETMEGDNPYGGDRITGRILSYRFNGTIFEYTGITYPTGYTRNYAIFSTTL